MAVETKTIKMRRGKELELDKSKLLAGEFGIATDTQKVFIGMGSGKTKELASREDVQTLIDNFGNVVDAEIEYATKEIREEGERVLATIPDDFETTAAKADEAVRTKSDAIILTETGERITNPLTSNDPMRGLKLYGKGEQRTTTGKQLANFPDGNGTHEGVKWTSKDGVVTASGTSTAISTTTYAFGDYNVPIIAGTYYISGTKGDIHFYVAVYRSNGTKNYYENASFSLDGTEEKVTAYCQIQSGKTVSGTIYPMLNYGTEPLPWEPYTGGQPSPSLDYPQEIETCGKVWNLLDLADKTTTAATYVYKNVPVSVPKGIYTFSCKHNLSLSVGWYVKFYNASGLEVGTTGTLGRDQNSATFEITEDATTISIYVNSAVTMSEIMLNEGTTALPYRPYNGGQREIETEVLGVQLLKMLDRVNFTAHEVTWNIKNGMCTASGTAGSVESFINTDLKNTGYKTGVYFVGNTGSNIVSRLAYKLPNESYKYAMGGSYVELLDFSEYENIVFQVMVKSGVTVNETVYPMLHYGKTEQTWQPYSRQSHITTVPNGLPGIEVTDARLANYVDEDGRMWCCDEVDYERGVYVQRVKKIVFDGSETLIGYASGLSRLPAYKPSVKVKNDVLCLCTHLKSVNDYNSIVSIDNTVRIAGDLIILHFAGYIGVGNDFTDDTALFTEVKNIFSEQHTNGTPVTVYYILATPIETPLPESEIAAYRALHSNYPTTNISNDCDAGMEVSMNADLKLYIDNKIAEISTAILNN